MWRSLVVALLPPGLSRIAHNACVLTRLIARQDLRNNFERLKDAYQNLQGQLRDCNAEKASLHDVTLLPSYTAPRSRG